MKRSATTSTTPALTERLDERPSATAPPGALVLGRYRLERRLGSGGFGVVWLAVDERLEREVAVKAIPIAGDEPALAWAERGARAEREARAAARLNHPGIVALYELAADREAVYLVSELVRGRTYDELARAGALADRDVTRIGAALADALGHAHAKGVIHRDVKPQNVIVVDQPAAGAGFAKLTDFGVAHVAGADALTGTGDVVGTLAYMAPEQAEGWRVTPAADVYSLALVVYEGLAGENPVRAEGPAATARRLGQPLPPLPRRDLPADLRDAIDAALDPRPDHRPRVHALGGALQRASELLTDEGGLAETETLERVGLTRRGRLGEREYAWTEPLGSLGQPPALPPVSRRLRPTGAAALDWPSWSLWDGLWRLAFPGAGRLAAGLAAGALVLAALEGIGKPPPLPALPAAAAVALAVALLPRLGWLAAAAATVAWLGLPGTGLDGAALIGAAALAATPIVLPRAGRLWSLPALAPVLGAIGLAPLFVGVAALARSVPRRAGLAAAGFLWLVAGELLSGQVLLFGAADAGPDASVLRSSAIAAARDGLYPLITTPALAPAAAWALFAVVLPIAVRGRSPAHDLAGGAVWVAGLVAAHVWLAGVLGSAAGTEVAGGALVSALLAACVASVAGTTRAARRAIRGPVLP